MSDPKMPYTATSLDDIADAFEMFASDQLSARRWQSTKRAKTECEVRAGVWRDAADMLRKTTIVGTEQ